MDNGCFLAEFKRGNTRFFFEKADKMIGVFNADHLTDITYLFISIQKQVFGMLDSYMV